MGVKYMWSLGNTFLFVYIQQNYYNYMCIYMYVVLMIYNIKLTLTTPTNRITEVKFKGESKIYYHMIIASTTPP